MQDLVWPESADIAARNPMAIEDYLKTHIAKSGVALLGELELDALTSYAGADWSMHQLATYALHTPAVQNRIESQDKSLNRFPFPSILAVWAVARAQELEDGDELWATAPVSKRGQSRIGPLFRESIVQLGLEDFGDTLHEMQQYIALARMHAIVPTYALRRFCEHMRRAAERHADGRVLLHELQCASDLAVPVRKLLVEKPDLGLDLLDRSLVTLARHESAGLPPRITDALLSLGVISRGIKSGANGVPRVHLDEDLRQLYVNGSSTWHIETQEGGSVDANELPLANIDALHGSERFPVLRLDDGYFVFDVERQLSDSRALPGSGAFLLWSDDITFDESILVTEPETMDGQWSTWKLAAVRTDARIELRLPNGNVRILGVRPQIDVSASPLPWLQTSLGDPVYASPPMLLPNQSVTVINNLTSTRQQLMSDEPVALVLEAGAFDITLYSTLGRSRQLRGVLVPNLGISGTDQPIVGMEQRPVTLDLPIGWSGETSVVVSGSTDPSARTFTIFDSERAQVNLSLVPTIATWSISFQGGSPTYLAEAARYRSDELSRLRRIVLHRLSQETAPSLHWREDGGPAVQISGVLRRGDAVYDLRPFQNASKKKSVVIEASVEGRRIKIVEFLPRQERIVLQGLSDLRKAVEAQGWFSDEEWTNMDREREQRNREIRTFQRMRRW